MATELQPLDFEKPIVELERRLQVFKPDLVSFHAIVDQENHQGASASLNLRLPSGTLKDYGNLEYDVNLLVNEKAFDSTGQMYFDIFDFDGFLGHGDHSRIGNPSS